MNSLKKLVYSLESTIIYESDEEGENAAGAQANGLEGRYTQEFGSEKKTSEFGEKDGLDDLEKESPEKTFGEKDGLEKDFGEKEFDGEKEFGEKRPGQGSGLDQEAHNTPGLRTLLQTIGYSIKSVLYAVCVQPVLLIWLLVTFPFSYIFGSEYPNLEAGQTTLAETSATDEKAALLKEEKILANNIKTPTAYKYILPPPPRLFPLSRNPDRKRRKKTLILDLDETLIHSLSRGAPRSLGANNTCHMIELKINNIPTLYYVYKRPFCDFFLKEVAKWFELQIFTASVKEYADPIIDWLESDIIDYKNDTQSVFSKRYYRSDCTFRSGVGYIKDLSKFCAKDDELKNVIILDNSPVSYALHEDNAIMIEGWINDPSDRDLLNLLPMLYSLSVCIDVRFILGLRSGEKLFEAARN